MELELERQGSVVGLKLEAAASWPPALRNHLDDSRDLFVDWLPDGPHHFSPASYDRAIYRLRELLWSYSLVAWHCTRLTDDEIGAIIATGMQPPSRMILHTRIDALLRAGTISVEAASQLKARNQADEDCRRGRIFWCFYPPRESGEGGIRSLLETWGGEALYNSHDDHPVMGPQLRAIGTPALIEADIPLVLLGESASAAFSVVANYLASLGHVVHDGLRFEDRITSDLPAGRIRKIHRYADPSFVALTACNEWSRPPGSW